MIQGVNPRSIGEILSSGLNENTEGGSLDGFGASQGSEAGLLGGMTEFAESGIPEGAPELGEGSEIGAGESPEVDAKLGAGVFSQGDLAKFGGRGAKTGGGKGLPLEVRSKVEQLFKSFEDQYNISGKSLVFAMSVVPPQAWTENPDQAIKMVLDQLPIKDTQKFGAGLIYKNMLQNLDVNAATNPAAASSKAGDEMPLMATAGSHLSSVEAGDANAESTVKLASLEALAGRPRSLGEWQDVAKSRQSFDSSFAVSSRLAELADGDSASATDATPKNSQTSPLQAMQAALAKKVAGMKSTESNNMKTSRVDGSISQDEVTLKSGTQSQKGAVPGADLAKANAENTPQPLAATTADPAGSPYDKAAFSDAARGIDTGNGGKIKAESLVGAASKGKLASVASAAKEKSGARGVKEDFVMPNFFEDAQGVSHNSAGGIGGSGIAMDVANATPEDLASENIENIVARAQFLTSKGGGEMRVKLHPESMGEVDLKVILTDGKVSLQFHTTNREAKAMIEREIDEIRTRLTKEDLALDRFSVEAPISSGAEKHLENSLRDQQQGQSAEQNGSNARADGDQQGRQATQQFWNQFNDSFGRGTRDWITEPPGRKNFEPSAAAPLTPVTKKSVKGAGGNGKGGGLNVVA